MAGSRSSRVLYLSSKKRPAHSNIMTEWLIGAPPSEQLLSIIFHWKSQKTPFSRPQKIRKKRVSSAFIFGRLFFFLSIALVSQKVLVTPSPFKIPNKTARLFVTATSVGLLQLWFPLPARHFSLLSPPLSANETPAGGPAVNTNALIVKSTISQPK